MDTARQVFISHASGEHDQAMAVCTALEACGITFWVAPRDIPPPHQYAEAIVDGVAGCALFLLLLTDGANASPNVAAEVEQAHRKHKPILPVRLADVQPGSALEYFVTRLQFLDMFPSPFDQRLPYLCQVVAQQVLGRRDPLPAPASSVPATAPTGRRVVLLYKRHAQPDEYVLKLLEQRLRAAGHAVFIDRHLTVGMEWAKEIERQVSEADAVIPLLSQAALPAKCCPTRFEIAHEARRRPASPTSSPSASSTMARCPSHSPRSWTR